MSQSKMSKMNTPQKMNKIVTNKNTISQISEQKDNHIKDTIFSQEEQLLNLDPQQQGYFRLYSKEQNFQLRFQQDDEEKKELLTVRVSQSLEEGSQKLKQVKLELMSDIDVFFHQIVIINEESFRSIKQEQNLNMPFFQIPNLLIKTLQGSLDPKNKIQNVLSIQKNGQTHLNFSQLIDFTQIILLSLDLVPLNENDMKHQVMYKYNVYKLRERQLKFNNTILFDQMKQTNQLLSQYTTRSNDFNTYKTQK